MSKSSKLLFIFSPLLIGDTGVNDYIYELRLALLPFTESSSWGLDS
jgi:hypothetical protein